MAKSKTHITGQSLSQLAEALQPAIYEAGAKIMDIHKSKVAARLKPDGSPVTDADEAAEAILLPALAGAASDIPVISEENSASHQLGTTPGGSRR